MRINILRAPFFENLRSKWGTAVLFTGFCLVSSPFALIWLSRSLPGLVQFLSNFTMLIWCLGWTYVGIGAWLINSRDHHKKKKSSSHWHYASYFGLFAPTVVTFFVLAIILDASQETLDGVGAAARAYSFGAAFGLIGGFMSESIYPLAEKVLSKLTDKVADSQ